MSELRIEPFRLPAAEMRAENPLPCFPDPNAQPPPYRFSDDIPPDERRYFGFGCDAGPLPHRLQDSYARRRRPRVFKTAVLENEFLRARFMIELGGRLWSLYHKKQKRELLYVNPVFQPANLAVRDAWFSGGVEWNVGVRGHTPYTCSPVFAARVAGRKGTPVLRLYEWDRVRGIPYQMDFSLPDGSTWLLARMRLVNPHAAAIPMYWWSNIAAVERPDTRVLVPAGQALDHAPGNEILRVNVPVAKGVDRSYPARMVDSASIFYCIPPGRRPWIAALDGEGRGLVQASTLRLGGRKLFAWGNGPGGRRWQEFLSVPNRPYIELQAGLARTQEECLPMPARAEWDWVEAYGLMEADPAVVHGNDWVKARKAIGEKLDRELPLEALESERLLGAEIARRPPGEIIQHGSGWGALESLRRGRAGEKPFCGPETPFPASSLGPDQAPWRMLAEKRVFPGRSPSGLPGAWMVQPEWRRLLEEAARTGRSDHWLSWLHLGVMHYHARDAQRAEQAWKRSIGLKPSAWAWRNLAVLARNAGRKAEAADLMRAACMLLPAQAPLAVECLHVLLEAQRASEAMELAASLPPGVRENGRVKILAAQAAAQAGDLDAAENILRGDIEVANLREGETVLTNLWFEIHERRLAAQRNVPLDDALRARIRREFPPPPNLDFRMKSEADHAL